MDSTRFPAPDVAGAIFDFIAIRTGRPLVDPDPVAVELATSRRSASLPEIAAHLAGIPFDQRTLVRAFNSGDFAVAFEGALSKVAGVDFSAQTAESDPLLWRVPSRGIRPVDTPIVDVGTLQPVPRSGGPIPMPFASLTDVTVAAPALYGARFMVSRQLLIDDDVGLIDMMVRQLSGQAARIRTQLIAEALDGGTSIPDTTATGLDVTSVGEALADLRNATTPQGHVSNLRGEFLVIPPTREAVALTLNEALGRRLRIIVNPWLSADAYLICSPEVSPVLAAPLPIGSDGLPVVIATSPIETDPETGEQTIFDGSAFRFEAYLGVTLIDVTGVVRIPAS